MLSKRRMLGNPNSLLILDEKTSLSHSWSQYIFFLSIIKEANIPVLFMVMTSAELIAELVPAVEKQAGCFHAHS